MLGSFLFIIQTYQMKIDENIEITNEDNMLLMARYPDNYFDLAVVDPPYRDKNQPTKQMREKENGKMSNFGLKPKKKYFTELFRVSKNQIIWGANNFIEHLYNTNCFIFWDKLQSMDNYSDGELAWTSFDSIAKQLRYVWSGNRYGTPDNIKGVGKPTCRTHPTEKPEYLYYWIFENYAKENQKIIDTHLGSGNILKALYKINKFKEMNLSIKAAEIDNVFFNMSISNIQSEINTRTLF